MITVPDSVAFYWNDPINRASINVLAGGTEAPADLTLQEVERFELANLAARRIRVDYWRLLRSLWSATWEQSVQSHFPGARVLNYGQQQAFSDEIDFLAGPSVDSTWANDSASGIFELPRHGRLFTRFGLIENEREAVLQFYLMDTDGGFALSDDLDLGANWSDDGANRRVTIAGILPFQRHEDGIDPGPFAIMAQQALVALAATLS